MIVFDTFTKIAKQCGQIWVNFFVATGFELLLKVQKNAESGHTDHHQQFFK